MPNPYESPQPEPKPAPYADPSAAGISKIDVMQAFRAVFQHPEYVNNILIVLVLAIIPIIGGVLVMGYVYDVVIKLHRQPGSQIPKATFDRFSDYLMRGLWPFLVNLVLGMAVMVVLWIVFFVAFMLLAAIANAAGRDAGGILMGIGMIFMWLLIMVASAAVGLIMFPFMLRAGLSQDFGSAFDFGWARDFLGKLGGGFFLAYLFFVFLAMCLALVGFMCCIIGMYPAIAIVIIANAHFTWQAYQVYLNRGGTPIPIKE